MSRDGDDSRSAALGFLAIVEHEPHGLFGGYLALNSAGRPLEFHCTAPVKANRAQQILYGPTLAPYLYGEQIGHALVSRAKLTPPLVLTDAPHALAARDVLDLPVGLLLREATPGEPVDPALVAFAVGAHQVGVPQRFASDRETIVARLAPLVERLDLAEPFARIHEAIGEARKAA